MIRTVPDASLRLVDTARATLFDGENALDRGDAAVRGNALAKHLPHPSTHTRQTIVVEADAAGTLDAIHTPDLASSIPVKALMPSNRRLGSRRER